MPSVSKRPAGAAAAAAAPEKKAKKAERSEFAQIAESMGCPVEAFEGVMQGLAGAEHLNESVREMLLAAVPKSLGVPTEERSGLQVSMVNIVEEVLNEVALSLQGNVEAAEVEASATEGKKAELLEKVQEKEAEAKALEEEAARQKAALAEVAKSFAEAKLALADRRKEEAAAANALAQASAGLKEAQEVTSKDFASVLEGTGQASDGGAAILGLLRKCQGVEESLLAAIPAALLKKPEERGSFDVTLVAEAKSRLEAHIAALQQQVASLSSANAELTSAVAAEAANFEEQTKIQGAAAQAVVAAQAAHQQAREAVGALWASVGEADGATSTAAAMLKQRRAKLADFQTRSLGGFAALKCRSLLQVKEAEPMKVEPPTSGEATAIVAGA